MVWSDGSSFVNRHGPYEDLCFEFSNLSLDLLRIFADVCAALDVAHRFYPPRRDAVRRRAGRVRINRRDAVAQFVANVGVKA